MHTEDRRPTSVFSLYWQPSWMAYFPAFIASKYFDLWNHHIVPQIKWQADFQKKDQEPQKCVPFVVSTPNNMKKRFVETVPEISQRNSKLPSDLKSRTSNLILTCIFSAGFLLYAMLCTSVACSQNSDVEELMFVSEPNALLTNQNFCFKRDYDGERI